MCPALPDGQFAGIFWVMGSALAAFGCICLLPIATPRLSPQLLLLLLLTRGRPILSASADAV